MVSFDLPPLLQAEQAGRALALEACGPATVYAEPSLGGAAALAAARHLHNSGHAVSIRLPSLHVEGDDAFAVQFEVAASMDLPLAEAKETVHRHGAAIVIDGLENGTLTLACEATRLCAADILADRTLAWDGFSLAPRGRPHPFLGDALREEARSAEAVREIDRAAVEDYGLPGLCLMENAGTGAAVLAASLLDAEPGEGPAVLVVGFGNNGGDALVVARALLERGDPVRVLLLGDPNKLRGDAKENLDILTQHPDRVEAAPTDPEAWRQTLASARLIVDGIFGTGLSRDVEGAPARAIEAINAAGRPVLALDLPSGLHADTGDSMGVAVQAAATVTFAAPKTGLFRGDGPARCGAISLAGIGCPRALLDAD